MEVENDISYKIRGAIFNVFNKLGPGLLESAYEVAYTCLGSKSNCNSGNSGSAPDGTKFYTKQAQNIHHNNCIENVVKKFYKNKGTCLWQLFFRNLFNSADYDSVNNPEYTYN